MTNEEIRAIALEVAHGMDWEDLTNHGAGSCVASHGCAGVTQDDLIGFSTRFLAAITEKAEPFCYHYITNGTWDFFTKELPPDDAYDEGTLTKLFTHPAIEPKPAPLPDAQLCKFYDVDNFPDLVSAMDHHIEKLQAKLPPTPSLWPGRVREG